jgi:hypothetical protein
MSRVVSERSFEEAIECALLQHGPDACDGEWLVGRELGPVEGEARPGRVSHLPGWGGKVDRLESGELANRTALIASNPRHLPHVDYVLGMRP